MSLRNLFENKRINGDFEIWTPVGTGNMKPGSFMLFILFIN